MLPFLSLRPLAVTLGLAVTVALPAQSRLTIPPPRGHVNDFASVLTTAEAAQMESIAQYVRAKSGGELAIVTLPDLAGRDVAQVALQIGREWKVGASAAVGDRTRNTGVVVLLVPRESNSDGNGYIRIEVGNGAEGFVPDAVAGRIREEGTDYFRARRYGAGLTLITARLAQRYAAEFGFSLDSLGLSTPGGSARVPGTSRREGVPIQYIAFVVIVVVLLTVSRGGRSGCAPFVLGQLAGRAFGRRGRYHDWNDFGGFGGGGGGGGGGFGGFGGGGGFSGGGSSGSF